MKSIVVLEVEHDRPIPNLEALIAGRAWSIDGVKAAEIVSSGLTPAKPQPASFKSAFEELDKWFSDRFNKVV